MYKELKACRICSNTHLVPVVDLGEQMLTGVFPKSKNQKATVGPLILVKCEGDNSCGLLQLKHSYNLEEMYGLNYGYRSGLNQSMVQHLNAKVQRIMQTIELTSGDLILDIGSNDSTTLRGYPTDRNLELVGIDPTGKKFHTYYPENVKLIPDFFSSSLVTAAYPGKKAKVITSFSMFYDLESPMQFMQEVHSILDEDGIWVFEQSYMPTMLETNSYDTVCHEHLEFYALAQIKWMTDKVGFKIIDVEFNDVNGGSFSVSVSKKNSKLSECHQVAKIIENEKKLKLHTTEPYFAFDQRIKKSKETLLSFLMKVKNDGKKVAALGASTKGNVLLQYCDVTQDLIAAVGEVNPEKYGCYTPGTYLPIVEESKLLSENYDYLIVLPWHFKKFFLNNEKFKKTNLVFPLPELQIVNGKNVT